jgi:polyhydroxyalkanoate synthesis regulator phasin
MYQDILRKVKRASLQPEHAKRFSQVLMRQAEWKALKAQRNDLERKALETQRKDISNIAIRQSS